MARLTAVSTSFAFPMSNIAVTDLNLTARVAKADSTTWGSAVAIGTPGVVTFEGDFEGYQEGVLVSPGTLGTMTLTFSGSNSMTWTTKSLIASWRQTGTAADGSVTIAGAFKCDGDYT